MLAVRTTLGNSTLAEYLAGSETWPILIGGRPSRN